jgi:uncharacterized protein (TIGR03086 family)
VGRVRAAQWLAPTPCVDWTVRDLVAHVVGEDRWTVPLVRGATIAEVGGRLDGDLLGHDPAGAAREAAKEALYAVAEPGVTERTVHLSFGDASGAEFVWQLFADHLVHSWDLARALGADDRLDPGLVSALSGWFASVEEMFRGAGVIGPRVPLPAEADPQARLLAGFGRDAAWGPALGLVQRFGAAFGRADVDAVMALMTDDCVFESTNPPPDGVRVEGAAAVRATWERLFAETRNARFTTEEAFAEGDRGVLRWVFRWQRPDGGEGRVRGVDVLRLRDGLVAEKLSYVKG